MKQSLVTGRLTLFIVLCCTVISWLTACSRLPRRYTSASTPVETSISPAKVTPINVNTVSAAELERLPGVGSVLAERIITYREENGRFRRAEHLMMVRGISDRKFREIRPLVRVE
ncbi:hypothetical protein BH18ACI4_BH18ACI4_13880 [soil metagenome]